MKYRGFVGLLLLLSQVSIAGTWYGDVTYSSSDGDIPSSPITKVDNSDSGWQLAAGYDVNKHFAVEFGYVDYGQQSVEIDSGFLAVSAGTPGSINPILSNLPTMLVNGQPINFSGTTTAIVIPNAQGFATETTAVRFAGIGKFPLLTSIDLDFQAGALVPRYKTTRQVFTLGFPAGGMETRTDISNEPEFFVGLGLHWRMNPAMGLKVFWEKLNDLGNEDTFIQDIDTYNLALRYQF